MARRAHPFFLTATVLLFLVGTASAVRPIPNTTSRVLVWADQLDVGDPSTAHFVAENFTGSQKLTKNIIDWIRTYNPDFLVVQYHKAYGVDIGYNIIGPNQWGEDIATMRAFAGAHPEYGPEESYYLHWTNAADPAHRIEHYWAGRLEYHLGDVSHIGFRTYIAHETVRRCETTGYDGTFFDVAYFPNYEYEPDFNPSVGLGGDGRMWYTYPPFNWSSLSVAAVSWNNLIKPYWQFIRSEYRNETGKYLAIANCDEMITGWYPPDYLDHLDGGLSEAWMTDRSEENSRLVGTDWDLSASRVLRYLTGNGKILIAQPNAPPSTNTAMRQWWIANYFLLKNDRSFYYYDQGSAIQWWPEYEIDLGDYISPPPLQLRDLLVPGRASLYQRQYHNGRVVVNPGETTEQLPLTETHYRYVFSGGGAVVEGRKPAMTLDRSEPVRGTLTVAPHTAVILWKPDPFGTEAPTPPHNVRTDR